MKYNIALMMFVLFFAGEVLGQSTVATEEIARGLEESLSTAILNNDIIELDRLWADDITVNNPANRVVRGKEAVLDRVRSGIIQYDSYEQEIESVLSLNEMLIVMGKEVITPIGNAPGAGQTLERRYTNVWVNDDGTWLLRARHANIICGM